MSAQWATGGTSGTPSVTNNSKYYSEQASDSADSASRSAGDASGYATTASNKAGEASQSASSASGSATSANADALKAEGHAVGKQDGTDVGSSSPYYHNNAKYYKEQASSSATNAGNSATSAGQSATSAGNDALKAEGYAVGKQNGTDVASGSPYYENNAKYYADQAESVLESIPEDYTALSNDVSNVKSAIDQVETTVYPVTYDEYADTFSCTSGTNIGKNTKILDVNLSQDEQYTIILEDPDGRLADGATIYVYENVAGESASSRSTYEIKTNIPYEKTATKNVGWISVYIAGTSITSSGTIRMVVRKNVVTHNDSLVQITKELQGTVDDIAYNNILYKDDQEVVSGTTQYVYKLIFTVNNPSDNTDYGIRVEKVAGALNNQPLYIYIYDSGNTRHTYSMNTREGDAYICAARTSVGDLKVEFVLYPSLSGGTTAVFDGIVIYKGTKPQTRIYTEAVMTSETRAEIEDIANDTIDKYKGIKPEQTDFFFIGINRVNPADIVSEQYVNQTNGAFSNNANYSRTGYVPVEPQTSYIIKTSRDDGSPQVRYAFYNASKEYISGDYVSGANYYIVTSPQNASFVAFSTDPYYFPMMFGGATSDVPYQEYGVAYILPQYIVEDVANAILNVPGKIYATSGIECNIYFENITENWDKYAWNVDCTKGEQLERGYRITPVDADAGTYTLTISISPKNNLSVSKQVQTTLVITAASAGSGVTKSVIVLGDSTTYNGTVISKLHENFSGDVMGISTLGTMGTSPNNHEGRSGWTLNDYFTKASITYPAGDPRGTIYNPFYNPTSQTFDANYYFANSGVSKPDWFFINMGINDMFSYTADDALDTQIATCIGYLNSMITSIKNASENTKIGICVTIPPNASQDAFGKAYSCGQTRNRYKHNNAVWAAQIISEFYDMESNGVYIIPIHTNLDTVYNMGMETLPVNARNTDVTYQSPIGNGGVHPAGVGYWQIADVYTAFLKAHAND